MTRSFQPDGPVCLATEALAAALDCFPAAALLLDGERQVLWANYLAGRLFGLELDALQGAVWPDGLPRARHPKGFPDHTQLPTEVSLPLEGGGVLLFLCDDLRRLAQRVAQLSVLMEIASILHATTDLDQVLRVILTGVTSGKGLQFNRAFLLLVDQSKGLLEGRVGLGPRDAFHAGQIWSDLAREDLPLQELLLRAAEERKTETHLQEVTARLTVSLERRDHILIQVLHGREICCCGQRDEEAAVLGAVLGSGAFCVVPIRTAQRRVGVLLADNVITGASITDEDREVLRSFANQAGIAIEKATLYDELQKRLTELEETRNALVENQKRLLEAERLRAVGEIAARVAHEIRNPLVAIGGYAARIIRRKEEGDADLPDLQVIHEETERLEILLQELLDYASPPTRPRTQPTSLMEIVERTARVAEEPLTRSELGLELDIEEGLPEVRVDAHRIRQVLINLMRNARQASPPGGTVTVRARRGAGGIDIEVCDTGPGVPAKDREQVFAPFFTTKPEGSGLGLAVARRIAEEHGGSLVCAEGPGGRFILHLPLKAEDAENGNP